MDKHTLAEAFTEIVNFIKRIGVNIVIIMGFAGALSRIVIEGGKKHTLGQRFVIVAMGGIVAYFAGNIANYYKISPEWMSFIGFMCGMFGYSIMKYIIDNEKNAFHRIAMLISKFFDMALSRLLTWIPTKKEKDEENTDANNNTDNN